MLDSYIKIFIMTLGLPALAFCCAQHSTAWLRGRSQRYFGGKMFPELEM